MMSSDDPQPARKPESDADPAADSDRRDQAPSLDTRFLWVLLGVMITMVALPLLPENGRKFGGALLMLWLAYELWVLLFRTFARKKGDS